MCWNSRCIIIINWRFCTTQKDVRMGVLLKIHVFYGLGHSHPGNNNGCCDTEAIVNLKILF